MKLGRQITNLLPSLFLKGAKFMKPIYLDYNATTPIDEKVIETMMPYLRDNFGNPSSNHAYGRINKDAIATARAQVADLLGCDSDEVIFTSGGSESDNHAIKGVALANKNRGKHIITSVIEHPAVINPCRFLEREGYSVTYLPVDRFGMVDPRKVEDAITPRTILITIMHANNEVGTIQPIGVIGEIANKHGVLFHTDAAQSVGKIPTMVNALNVDLLTVAGHKLYAPKGIGALYVRKGVYIEPLIHGAGHELGRRAGTENVANMVGLGTACELANATLTEKLSKISELRDQLHGIISDHLDDVVLNGHPDERLPNTLNIGFREVSGAEVLAGIPQIAASTGSACHEGSGELSGVLKEMNVDPSYGFGALRLSLGRYTTEQEIQLAAEYIINRVKELRTS